MKLLRLSICLLVIWTTLFFYIDENNELTELRRLIPELEKEVKALEEDNIRLTFEIEQFENPSYLMELARKPEYSHLKYPYFESIIILQEPKF
jgi:cell division protein FtsB